MPSLCCPTFLCFAGCSRHREPFNSNTSTTAKISLPLCDRLHKDPCHRILLSKLADDRTSRREWIFLCHVADGPATFQHEGRHFRYVQLPITCLHPTPDAVDRIPSCPSHEATDNKLWKCRTPSFQNTLHRTP